MPFCSLVLRYLKEQKYEVYYIYIYIYIYIYNLTVQITIMVFLNISAVCCSHAVRFDLFCYRTDIIERYKGMDMLN